MHASPATAYIDHLTRERRPPNMETSTEWSCSTCATSGRRGYCAPLRCYCGHETCHAFVSWQALPEASSDATATPMRDGRAWAAREEGSSWIDKL